MHFGQDNSFHEPAPKVLRASGNLTYLEFIRLVQRIWREAHPSIPIVAEGHGEQSTYPVIVYSLELRQVHSDEPKPKYRETRFNGEKAERVMGQRFRNVINFSAMTQQDPVLAEEIIETFEDFMMEYTGVFKELGASELTYGRRVADKSESRSGMGVTMRTVQYLVVLEKIKTVEMSRIEDILISARVWLDKEFAVRSDRGTIYDSSPRYYIDNSNQELRFIVSQEDIDNAENPYSAIVRIPGTNFRVGDRIYLSPDNDATPDTIEFQRGFYIVSNIINYAPYSALMGYILQKWQLDGATPSFSDVEITDPIEGYVFYMPDRVLADILDSFMGI